MNSRLLGYICGAAAGIFYGLNPLFGLRLYSEGVGVMPLLFYRFLFATILMAGYMLLTGKSFRVPRKILPALLIEGVLLALTCITLFASFKCISSSVATTVLYTYPVVMAIVMSAFFGEKLTLPVVSGIVLACGGVALICLNGQDSYNLPGILYAFASGVLYVAYIVFIKQTSLRRLSSESVTFYSMLIGDIVFLLFLRGGYDLQAIPSLSAFGNLMGLALFTAMLSFLCLAVSTRCIGETITSVLGALEPVTAVIIGVTVFDEPAGIRLFAGVVMVIVAVSAVALFQKSDKRISERE